MASRAAVQVKTVADRRVLLVGSKNPIRDPRAMILKNRGVYVDVARNALEAQNLCPPGKYDLILVDLRRDLPNNALDFYEQVKSAAPKQRIAFFVGPPLYVSETWPDEAMARGPRQWDATVQWLLHSA